MKKLFKKLFRKLLDTETQESGEQHDLNSLESSYSLIMRHANAPRLDIELDVSPKILEQLVDKVEKTWSHLGQEDAHWSVITDEKFRRDHINTYINDFFAMGEGDIARVETALNRVNTSLSEIKSAMDFGCGVGRLSIPLAKRCQHVLGVDISAAHLAEAKTNIQRQSIKNLDLSLVESVGAIRDLQKFDLVFSLIVLQHNSPPVMLEILKALCSRVDNNGYLYLQAPTYRDGYSYDAKTDLENISTEMDMHVLPQDILLQTIQDAGLTILEVTEDGSAWNLEFRSQVILAKRRYLKCDVASENWKRCSDHTV